MDNGSVKKYEMVLFVVSVIFVLMSLSVVSRKNSSFKNEDGNSELYYDGAVEVGKKVYSSENDYYIDELAAYDLRLDNAVKEYIDKNSPEYVYPIKGTITSEFSYRTDPIDKETYALHTGIDIAPYDDLCILAYTDGTVVRANMSDDGYGNCIVILHDDSLETLYAHCSKLLVSVGDEVKAGDIIAIAGSTGRSTGTHLHFETRINGIPTDPLAYMKENGGIDDKN